MPTGSTTASASISPVATRAAVLLHGHGRIMLDALLERIARDGAVPEGSGVPVLPYCPFPSGAMLRGMRRQGRYLTDVADLREAVSLSARAG